jgi:hypothetical protein
MNLMVIPMRARENPMKDILFLFLVIAGCIAAGCVGQMKSAAYNTPNITLANTFTSFSNATLISNLTNISNSTAPPALKGLLKISTGGWTGEFPVSIDNLSRGVVATQRPITVMLEEGNHTVEVCCGVVCERENVTIRFGEQRIIDFSDRLKKDCEFLEPVARIVGYFMNSNQIAVNVEFINPTTETLTMTAEISCGYSYIESRSNDRVGNHAQGLVVATLNSGERTIKMLNLNLASGYSYNFGPPTITRFDQNKF